MASFQASYPPESNSLVHALKNAMEMQKTRHEIPLVDANVQSENLKNLAQSITNKYLPEDYKTQFDQRRAQTGYLGAEEAFKRAEIPFLGTKYDIERLNANAKARSALNSATNAFRMWTQTDPGRRVVMDDPSLASKIYESILQSAVNATGTPLNPMQAQQNIPSQQQPSSEQQSSSAFVPYKDVAKAISQVGLINQQTPTQDQSNSTMPTNPEKLEEKPPLFDSKEAIVKDIQDAAADAYAKSIWPPDVKKRLYAGDRYKATVPIVLQNFDLAKNYFSSSGKMQLERDEKQSLLSHYIPPQLQAYRNFMKGVEQLKVQGAFLEGVPADIKSREDYANLYDISMIFNNPQGAMATLKNAIDITLLSDQANRANPSSLLRNNKKDDAIKEQLSKLTNGTEGASTIPDKYKNYVPMTDSNGKLKLVHPEDVESAIKDKGYSRR